MKVLKTLKSLSLADHLPNDLSVLMILTARLDHKPRDTYRNKIWHSSA